MTLVAVLAAGCGGGGRSVTEPSPLVTMSGVTAGGAGVLGSYPTTLTADYTPNRNFGLAFLVRNRSDAPVTIVGLSSDDENEKRFARLVGASTAAFVPIDCDGHSCPAPDLGLRAPYDTLPPLTPLTIPSHKQASIQLHFRWVPCLDAPVQTAERENTTLVVNYQTGGRAASQLLRTGQAQLDVSAASACASPESS